MNKNPFSDCQSNNLASASQEHLVKVNHQRPEPPVRGEALWRWFDLSFLRLNRVIQKAVPESLNPFAQTGAVTNTMLVISIISGILVLLWYDTSVHTAYSSVEAMKSSPWTAQLMRSLHRYSSDACMFFLLLHAVQIFVARRFGGARWVAWVTGVLLMGLLWFDGWLGYWLVWDEKAKMIALGSAKMLDALPIFSDSLMRSFLTDAHVNTLLFFVVFFMHMLIPLGICVALWLHLTRVSRPRFFTNRQLTGLIILSLVVISLWLPAESAKAAKMQTITAQEIPFDWLYMMPLVVINRLEGGALWLIFLTATIVVTTVPWWMTRNHPKPAYVLQQRCNGCSLCFQDCPYNAITLNPAENKYGQVALIDPNKCVGCGICVGACDPGAIIFPKLPVQDAKGRIHQWLDKVLESESRPYIAFLCASSAGSDLEIDEISGRCRQLPGYHVLAVPCSGWVHPLLIERAARRGAAGVLVVGCGPDPMYRTGTAWTEQRLKGERQPALRQEKVANTKVGFVRYDRAARAEFFTKVAEFRENGRLSALKKAIPSWRGAILATMLLTAICGLVYGLSIWPYRPSVTNTCELVVSFKHPGKLVAQKTTPNKPDQELLDHMKGANSVRRVRVPVRLRVLCDGEVILNQEYRPRGLFQDGNSIVLARVPVSPGKHKIVVEMGDTENKQEWNYRGEKVWQFQNFQRRVILFNKVDGFTYH